MRARSWWTLNLGQVRGIAVRVHLTLVLLLAWIAGTYALAGAGLRGTAIGLALVVCVFCVILVHELGHALMARRFGYKTRDIMLLPIGGIASLEHMPEEPHQELAVAVVGPLINLAIAGLLWLGISAAGGSTAYHQLSTTGSFAAQLLWINVGLALFNLIPAFPMDGGRALRAVLALKLDRERATNIAAGLGRLFAAIFGVLGFFYNPLLVLIALVVWYGASQERAIVALKSVLHGVPVRAAMQPRISAIAPDAPLEDAAALLLSQGEVPVVEHGEPAYALTRGDVASALAHAEPHATVASAPHHDVVTVAPDDPLERVVDQLRQAPEVVAVVIDHGVPVGMVSAERLAQWLALHERKAAA